MICYCRNREQDQEASKLKELEKNSNGNGKRLRGEVKLLRFPGIAMKRNISMVDINIKI